jgi:hypothetical protein
MQFLTTTMLAAPARRSGTKRTLLIKHRFEHAAFVLINEPGYAVVSGRSEIAAFNRAFDDSARGEQAV